MSLVITIEGLDGVGKSTLANAVVEYMKNDRSFADWIYYSKEPGSPWTGIGPDLRKLVLDTPDLSPLERELIFYVDASKHRKFIENQGGALIVSDRGLWSHLAYLRGYLKTKQMDYDEYRLCRSIIDQVCYEPDCVVYLRGDLGLMNQRLEGKQKDAIESNGLPFFAAVEETYEDLIQGREWSGKPLLILDARATVGQNTMEVVNYLKGVFHAQQLREGSHQICGI